jgi:hypothetical protein
MKYSDVGTVPDFCDVQSPHVEGRLQVLVAENDGGIPHVEHLLVANDLLQYCQHLKTRTERINFIYKKWEDLPVIPPKCIPVLPRNQRPNLKKIRVKAGPYAGVNYNLTLPYAHTRVDSNTFTMDNPMSESTLNPMPESTFTLCQSRLYPPVRDFGFGLRIAVAHIPNLILTRECRKKSRGNSPSV